MLEAGNSFKQQAKDNPHGWEIGWYENNKPLVEKCREKCLPFAYI